MAKEFATVDAAGERQVFMADNIEAAEKVVRANRWNLDRLEPTYRQDVVIGASSASAGVSAPVAGGGQQ